ncbi:cytochrome c biogenesis CcdA family protein [Clostridium butyricum]|uniref:Cytochrome c biogenesis protein CcdA n=2 Tax=root TaxID=1 RepID=A0A6L9EQF9_CLOBU|nr:cytochrome c biogenesis protein CcdA [Clostridium butyricum]ETI91206.1 MAG: Cytochrome c biogenesis protein, transmembrane region [Clostridium butyricum DORA_1]MDU1509559.1 cytochrome c biogenesis protein CcdA [Clostridium butyricum]MDU4802378.1 cytochrome c biogenesis protein CcdA [Clostridium butyricum]MDU5722705.1 cytochrome c biogenesis protein CcdA [Clostridium butyricum]MDU5820902.1 cytochrome c biogenesis protein CcdA [Clostridium butyricum]
MKHISILLAFSAGLLSFLSPCVLPLVPAYISYLTGSSIDELKAGKTKLFTLYKSLGFVLGFSIIFILMGVSITSLGKLLITHKDVFRKIGGALIIVFGLHTIGIFRIKLFYREKRFLYFDKIKGPFSSVIMGMAFATGWTPCIGPILSSILIYATSMDSINKGMLLLIMYSIGLAVPFILTAMVIEGFSEQFKKFSKYLPIISIISGVLMIIMGIMIFTNKLAVLSQYTSFINF